MFAAMLTILMLQLRSFLETVPRVFHCASRTDRRRRAHPCVQRAVRLRPLLGVIALAGMIMRNTVILVDQIDHDRAAGLSPFDAIVESTAAARVPWC